VEQKIHGDQLSRHPYCSDSGGDDWFPVSAARCEKCHFTNGGDFPRRFCACFLGAFLFSAAGTAGFLLAGVLRKTMFSFSSQPYQKQKGRNSLCIRFCGAFPVPSLQSSGEKNREYGYSQHGCPDHGLYSQSGGYSCSLESETGGDGGPFQCRGYPFSMDRTADTVGRSKNTGLDKCTL